MKIELLDDKTVKVLLSKIDMLDLNLSYDDMDYKDPQTKRVLLRLVEEIKREIHINLNTGKLFIEAFPYVDGGCILYVNILEASGIDYSAEKKYKACFDTPLVFMFGDINSLGKLSNRLINGYGHIILKSSLFLFEKKYYLLLYTYFKMDCQLTRLVSEYGKLLGRGVVASAIVHEHSTELIKDDAIGVLAKCIG